MSKPRADVEELVRQLYGLGRVRRAIGRHALAELGTQGFNALAVVYRGGPMRISDVAEELAVDLSVASRQVGALIEGGYVKRTPNPEDRRAWLVETTADGNRVLRESHRRMVHAFGAVLDEWSADEVRDLSAALARLSGDFARTAEQKRVAR